MWTAWVAQRKSAPHATIPCPLDDAFFEETSLSTAATFDNLWWVRASEVEDRSTFVRTEYIRDPFGEVYEIGIAEATAKPGPAYQKYKAEYKKKKREITKVQK